LTTKNRYGNTYYPQEKLFCVNCNKIIQHDFDYEINRDAKLFFENKLRNKIDEHNRSI
jgi:hypothetical protein